MFDKFAKVVDKMSQWTICGGNWAIWILQAFRSISSDHQAENESNGRDVLLDLLVSQEWDRFFGDKNRQTVIFSSVV